MYILIVACDKKSGEILREEIAAIQNEANIVSFDNSFAALLYARRNQVDIAQDLMNTLKTHGIADIIAKQRGSMGIVKNHIECDIYDWLDKKEKSIYNYLGEYMSQYSWAEVVHAEIDNIKLQMEAR